MEETTKNIIILATGLVFIFLVCLGVYYLVMRNVRKVIKKLEDANPDIIRFKEKFAANELRRHEIMDGYMQIILYYHSELRKHVLSKKWFKSSILPQVCVQMMSLYTAELFRWATGYLKTDIDMYVKGEELEKCQRTMKIYNHMLSDIGKILMDRPELSLQMYSDYFTDLIDVCQMISNGIEHTYSQNTEIRYDLQNINSLIEEYRPIAKLYDHIRKDKRNVIGKINERYEGRINKISHISNIWDDTLFIIFDDMIVFIIKFYEGMDRIEDIVASNK